MAIAGCVCHNCGAAYTKRDGDQFHGDRCRACVSIRSRSRPTMSFLHLISARFIDKSGLSYSNISLVNTVISGFLISFGFSIFAVLHLNFGLILLGVGIITSQAFYFFANIALEALNAKNSHTGPSKAAMTLNHSPSSKTMSTEEQPMMIPINPLMEPINPFYATDSAVTSILSEAIKLRQQLETIRECDEGIAKYVAVLMCHGVTTTDSGDGYSKPRRPPLYRWCADHERSAYIRSELGRGMVDEADEDLPLSLDEKMARFPKKSPVKWYK